MLVFSSKPSAHRTAVTSGLIAEFVRHVLVY
jgi:hypothetical protein